MDLKRNAVVLGILVRGCAEAMAERRRRGEWAAVLKEGDGGLEEQVGGYEAWSAWCHHQEIEESVGFKKWYKLKKN